jgi:DNA-binding IclR family transcriptional regulator
LNNALRALEVVDFIAHQEEPPTVVQIAVALGTSRTTLYRTLQALTAEGWLEPSEEPRRYALALKSTELSVLALKRNRIRARVLPTVVDLSRCIQLTCALSFYDRGNVLFTDSIEHVGEQVVERLTGERHPAAATASGKILLAHQSAIEIERVAAQGLPRFTPQTKTTRDEILSEIERCKALGYGLSETERHSRSGGLAVAVFDRSGRAAAAFGVVSTPLTAELIERALGPALSFAARASRDLGYVESTVRAVP